MSDYVLRLIVCEQDMPPVKGAAAQQYHETIDIPIDRATAERIRIGRGDYGGRSIVGCLVFDKEAPHD